MQERFPMTDEILTTLLNGNKAHVDSLTTDHFDGITDGQSPAVVSICCSDSRVPQEAMFDINEAGWLFTPSTIGNQVTEIVEGDEVINGSLLYPIHHAGTRTVAVVGHTGCGAVAAAYDTVIGDPPEMAPGIAKRIRLLVPVVRAALEDGTVDTNAPRRRLMDELAEANVHAQVATLLDSPQVPEGVAVYGFMYDLTGAYGGPRGRTWLVNASGKRNPVHLAGLVGEEHGAQMASLLQ
jgi:carbonic anhydrase